MKESEFFRSLDEVFGSVYGRSLFVDLVLDDFGVTAEQALARGERPVQVWHALVLASGVDEKFLWAHRLDKKVLKNS